MLGGIGCAPILEAITKKLGKQTFSKLLCLELLKSQIDIKAMLLDQRSKKHSFFSCFVHKNVNYLQEVCKGEDSLYKDNKVFYF